MANLDSYNFDFPKKLIAQKPARPRDAARLLVFDRRTRKTTFASFRDLPSYIPKGSVLVLNETKVIPARLYLRKPTGGMVEVLYLSSTKKSIKTLANKKLQTGMRLYVTKSLFFTVTGKRDSIYSLKPSFALARLDAMLKKFGHTPLPPYIKHTPLSERKLREEYQAIFAKEKGSVAAPTASLHFTKRLLNDLKKRGVDIVFVTLHVGLGTFASVTEEQIKTKKLHVEQYHIPRATAAFLHQAKKSGRPIIAVGTTVVRTLESSASSKQSGFISQLSGSTDLFIQEGYRFKVVDGMITNFHVPKSSLLMLVSAFAGRETVLGLYDRAIKKNFRLFSFGDGMFIS